MSSQTPEGVLTTLTDNTANRQETDRGHVEVVKDAHKSDMADEVLLRGLSWFLKHVRHKFNPEKEYTV